MDFKPKDFELLKYNPYLLPKDKNLLEVFPELSRFPEFSLPLENLDRDLIIRYIIFCYDKKSPLLSEKNLAKRKMLSCRLVEFEFEKTEPKSGRPPEVKPQPKYPFAVEEMIKGKNIYVNRMICRYCRNQNDLTYSLLVAGMESFFDNIDKLSAPLESTDMQELNKRAQLYQHMVTMIRSLESNADETFAGEIQLMYDANLIEQEDRGKVTSFPEFIATLRENGELAKTLKNK